MCGIVGVLLTEPGSALTGDDRAAVGRMLSTQQHRGPDRSTVLESPGALLGNTWLQVMDPSSGAALPMESDDGDVALAYNGEITNFRELTARHGLRERFAFRSGSDGEVLLHLYRLLGIACLEELSGMFAFCLVDRRRRRAWVVRDFFGTRPLYVSARRGRLWFASEIKALREAPGFDASLDLEGFHHFLGLGYFPGVTTPYAQVRELRAGRLLEVDLDAGGVAERRYFRPRYEPAHVGSEAALAGILREQMRDSVARNLVADAPVGLTLSGGLDTGSILALARDVVGPRRELHTFSIVMDEPSFDESRWQRVLVERFRPVHHEVRVGPEEIVADLAEHMRFLDEPTANGAAIPSFALARIAKPHVRALLSGEGGDEMFNAYETHLAHRVRALYRRLAPGPLRRAALAAAEALPCSYRKLSFDFLAKRFTRGAELDAPEAHYFWRHVNAPDVQRALLRSDAPYPASDSLFRAAWDDADGPDSLDRISAIDLEHYFVDDLMTKNDRTMMAHSIEARFPFADRILFDTVRRIPATLRLKGARRRHMQKLAMAPLLPEAILRRANMGLELPHSLWILGPLRPVVDRYLTRENVERTGLLHHGPVARMWADHQARRVDHGRPLWAIVNLLVWFDVFIDRGRAARH